MRFLPLYLVILQTTGFIKKERIGKITYISIFLGMTWIVVTTPVKEAVEGVTKLTEFFISALIPLIIGEMFGAMFENIVN